MFSLPQPVSSTSPESTHISDACPVVHLSDSPEDLRHVLRICLPRNDLRFFSLSEGQDTPSFDMVSALIRLGHKYQMQAMVSQGIQYLQRWFTDDFLVWSEGPLYEDDCPIQKEHAIGVVNLARLVDEPSLLPTALLACCALDETIAHGYTCEDGTRETLSADDLGRCFAARTTLAARMLTLALRIFEPRVRDSDACTGRAACARVLQHVLLEVRGRADHFAHPDVFSSWLEPFEEEEGTSFLDGCCASCRKMLRRRDMRERLEVWLELPEIMGVRVDGWDRKLFAVCDR
ncbi:hypothetical protein VTO73DRAFT_11982 [Trametes versicolor]